MARTALAEARLAKKRHLGRRIPKTGPRPSQMERGDKVASFKVLALPDPGGDYKSWRARLKSSQDAGDKLSKMSLTPSGSGDEMPSHQDDMSGGKTEEDDGLDVPRRLYDDIQRAIELKRSVESDPIFECQLGYCKKFIDMRAKNYKFYTTLLPLDWEFSG